MSPTMRTIRASEPAARRNGDEGVRIAVSALTPKQRRPSWIMLGVVLVGVAALVGAWIFMASSDQVSVMVAARDIEPGEVIDAGDLRVVEIGGSADMRAVQRDQQELLIGLAARGPIPAGTVLNTGLVAGRDQVIPPGWVVVGAELARGGIPSEQLAPGDRVDLLRTAKGTGTADGQPLRATTITSGSVWSVRQPDSGSVSAQTWVALLVPAATREDVAQAAADRGLSLALTGAEP